MASRRDSILKAKHEAISLHRKFEMQAEIESIGGNINVFDTLIRCGVPLMFRPLDGILGAYVASPIPGVIVTTKRPLSVQRFTAAHELGHAQLQHHASCDDESILKRAYTQRRMSGKYEEFEADTFAVEFLIPRWLLAIHVDRQGWDAKRLTDPKTVYQMSLRVGMSYSAMCYSLARPGIEMISKTETRKLLEIQPKDIKKDLLDEYEPSSWHGDVWALSSRDEGAVIRGSRTDLFVIDLSEHGSAGYVWNFDDLRESGFAVVQDERKENMGNSIGGVVQRRVTIEPNETNQTGEIQLSERRGWITEDRPLSTYRLNYDLSGPQRTGIYMSVPLTKETDVWG